MPDYETNLRKLVRDLDQALRELATFPEYDRVSPQPNPGASEEQIARYEAYLGRPLPPSYRAFIAMHDGYRALAYPGDMLSIEDVMPGGAWHERIATWKKTSAKYGSAEVVDGIVIANLGQPNNWAFLDPKRTSAKTKEMKVVEWEPEDSDEYPNVLKFLEECLETVRYGILEAKGEAPDDDDD